MAKRKQPRPPTDDLEHFKVITDKVTRVFFSLIHQCANRWNYHRQLLSLHNALDDELARVREEIECKPQSKTASTR